MAMVRWICASVLFSLPSNALVMMFDPLPYTRRGRGGSPCLPQTNAASQMSRPLPQTDFLSYDWSTVGELVFLALREPFPKGERMG